MGKIRCLLVDDEPPAIELLETYIGMIDHLEVVGKCHSAVHAFELMKDLQIDLIFLDIRMPLISGIDFVKSLSIKPAVIFTTAYREYAVEGYALDVIDYLLKPIAFDRFLAAIHRFEERTRSSEEDVKKSIYVNINRSQHKIILADIIFIESLKDYVRIHSSTNSWVVKSNIGGFMKKLEGDNFIRIHRSFAINTSYVNSHNKKEVVLNENRLPIGASYRDAFFDAMK